VKKIIEQQQLSNSRASSLYNTKVEKDHQEKINQKMLITPKFPQFEISKTVAPQSSLK